MSEYEKFTCGWLKRNGFNESEYNAMDHLNIVTRPDGAFISYICHENYFEYRLSAGNTTVYYRFRSIDMDRLKRVHKIFKILLERV